MNVVILSTGRISCLVASDDPLPAAGYTVLAALTEAIEAAAEELEALLSEE